MNKKHIILTLLASFIMTLVISQPTHAADTATMMRKWIYTDYWNCTSGASMNSPLEAKSSGVVAEDVFKTNSEKLLPSFKFGHTDSDAKANCKEIFMGTKNFSGVADYYGNNSKTINWSSPSSAEKFLNTLGYETDVDEEVTFKIKSSYTGTMSNYYFGCNLFGNNCEHELEGETESALVTVTPNNSGGKTYSFGKDNFFNTFKLSFDNGSMTIAVEPSWITMCTAPSGQSATFQLKNDVNEFYNDINSYFTNKTWSMTCSYTTSSGSYDSFATSTTTTYYYNYHFIADDIIDSSTGTSFTYNSNKNRESSFKTLNGGSDKSSLRFTDEELYTLYYYYLDSSLPTGTLNRMTCSPDSTTNLTAVKLKDSDGTFKTCYVNYNGTSPSSISVNIPTYDNHGPYIYTATMQTVIDWLNSKDSIEGDVPTVASPVDSDATTEDEPDCYDGAGSLGWILCPVLQGLGNAAKNLYTEAVEPALQMDIEMITGGVYSAWQTFCGFANIAFIILLLFVIFSQVTGVGIDNYGIKKIMPKLIIAAILINLSYLICQLAVEISNIVGSSIYNLLIHMTTGTTTANIVYGTGDANVSVSAGVTVLSVLIPVLVGAATILAQGWAVILPLLLAILSALIGVAFAFLLLAVRKAGVIILVVISPLAFVAYMLPNTKKLFDKWLKMFEGLLLLYPICGLLIGGGDFASRILLKSGAGNDSFFFALSAMLVNIAPFFFIPTVLKGSFAAMGNIGAKISGFGQNLSKRATSRIAGSEAYKNARIRSAAGINKNGKLTAGGKIRSKIANTGVGGALGFKSGMARARVGALKVNSDQQKSDYLMTDSYINAANAAQESAINKELLESEMARIKSSGPVDNDTYASALSGLLSKDTLTKDEQLQAKAYMKMLANGGGFGKKLLAKAAVGNTTSAAGRQVAAKFMSKDSDVASAIASKDAAAAQYLREVNNGKTESTFGNWKTETRVVDGTTMTGSQFVTNKITDKDEDFVAQADYAVEEAINSHSISDDRLRAIYDNELVYNSATEGVRKAISDHLGRPFNRGDYHPATSAAQTPAASTQSTPTIQTPATNTQSTSAIQTPATNTQSTSATQSSTINTQQPFSVNSNPTILTIDHGGSQTPPTTTTAAPTVHNGEYRTSSGIILSGNAVDNMSPKPTRNAQRPAQNSQNPGQNSNQNNGQQA